MQLKIWLVLALFLLIAWVSKLVYGKIQRAGLVVVTYNIRFDTSKDGDNAWPLRKKRLIGELLSHQPAIIGMQEVLHHQLQDVKELLPAHFKYSGVGRADGATQGEYAPIWYDSIVFELQQQGTFWLSETPASPSIGWDAALPRICSWVVLKHNSDGRLLWVFNTHLDHQGALAREKSTALIAKMAAAVPEHPPILILGDFNSTPQETPHQVFQREGWLDARATAEKREGPIGTFPDFDGKRPEKRIDFLYYKNLPPPFIYIVDGPPDRQPPFASDHSAVVVGFPW